ncbi:MAG: ricin-type beta-trefoil lectin domain protein [Pseudomonadota bacterium]|nr:ricin-type beta-trefoil lectin domain protein [Pseudomonadota bacterium]
MTRDLTILAIRVARCVAVFGLLSINVLGSAQASVYVNGQQTTTCLSNQGGIAALASCAGAELTGGRSVVQSGSACLTLQRGKPLTFSACARNDDQDWSLDDGHLRHKSGLCAEGKSNGQVTAEQCTGGAAQRFARADVIDLSGAATRIGLGPAGKVQLGIVDRAAKDRGPALGPGGTWVAIGDVGVAAIGNGRFLVVPSSGSLVAAKAGQVVGASATASATTISDDAASITTSLGGTLRLSSDIVAAAGGTSAVRTQLAEQLGINLTSSATAAASPAAAPTSRPTTTAAAPPSPAVIARTVTVPPPTVTPSPELRSPALTASSSSSYAPIRIGSQCVTVDSARAAAAVVLADCGGSPGKQFRLSGTQLFVNLKSDGRELCLDAGTGSEGELVTVQPCADAAGRAGASWSRNGDRYQVSTGRALRVIAGSKVAVLGNSVISAAPVDDGAIGQLDAFDTGAALLRETLQIADVAQNLAESMQTAARAGLLDPATASDAVGAVRGARYLLNGPGNPYSLAKLIAGTVVAMDEDERQAFNHMIAADGLVDQVREAKATLLASRSLSESEALAIASTFLERSTAEIPGGAELYLYREGQKLNLDGNDRAQTLVAILTFGRALNNSSTFAGGLTLAEQTASSFVEGATKYLEKAFPKHVGLSALEEHVLSKRITKFATAYTIAKVTTLMAVAAMNAMAVNTPTSISGVYMTMGGRGYVHNAPAWPLKVGPPNQVTGRVYVIPHTSDAQVITPLGIIGTVVDLGTLGGAGKFIERFKTTDTLRKAIDEAMKKAKTTWGIISHTQLDNLLNAASGKSWFPPWAAATQNYFSFKAHDLPPVEMNDTRVVKLISTGGANHIALIPGQQWIIQGVSAGAAGIKGELTDKVAGLWKSSGSATSERYFQIAINVIDDKPFVPWAPCGKPGDGGIMSPYTGKCEYPT